MVILGGWAVSYARGTLVSPKPHPPPSAGGGGGEQEDARGAHGAGPVKMLLMSEVPLYWAGQVLHQQGHQARLD